MSNARGLAALVGGAALLVSVAASTQAASKKGTATSGSVQAGTGGGSVPSGPRPAPRPPVPVVSVGTGSGAASPTPVASPGRVPPGPVWPANLAAGTNAGDVYALAAHIASRRPLSVPFKAERLALAGALMRVAQTEAYPLDLLIGHALAEGGGRACMSPTRGSGAYGPLQTTQAACQTVGASYPPQSLEVALRAAVRYMRAMRQTYPQEAVNLTATLRIYGLGIGNYRQFLQSGCVNYKSRPQSVWRAECETPTSHTYTGKIALETLLAAGGGFHTLPLSWWQR